MEYQNNIFCTPIWGLVLNNQKQHIQDYINFILNLEQTEPNVKISNLSGYQTRNTLHKESIFLKLVELLTNIGNDISEHHSLPKLKIDTLWANVNRYKDCNITHIHQGVISGVFYLRIPEHSGELVLCNPAVRSDNSYFSNKEYSIEPVECSCIIFPSWLEHYVEPNMSNEPRISMSFNFRANHD